MSKHPGCSWAILLQQSWSMRLQDRVRFNDFGRHITGKNGKANGKTSPSGGNDACRKYNLGKCPFGSGCKYDHKCSYCFKFGHTILTCRKLIADRDRNGGGSSSHHGHNQHNGHQHHGDKREIVIDSSNK